IDTMQKLVAEFKAPKAFIGIGWMGAAAGFFILSFYSVIAGWTLAYAGKMAAGAFFGAGPEVAAASFSASLDSPWTLMGLHSLFVRRACRIIALGVSRGLGNGVQRLMPSLVVMLVLLFGYALTTPGFAQRWDFMFSFEPEKITGTSFVVALGHAFFTLSIGMGAIMADGAYMPKTASLGKTVLAVGQPGTVVARTCSRMNCST